MKCAEVEKSELIEKYVTGDLAEGEKQRLEEHLLTCERCHEQLEDLSLLRTGLRGDRWAVAEERRTSPLQWGWAWVAAAVLLGIGMVLWPRLVDDTSEWDAEMAQLAEIEAPPYEPRRIRAPSSEAEVRFREAMTAYQEGAFAEAIPKLEESVRLDSKLAKSHFYLGACYLITEQPDSAIGSLSMVTDAEDSQYLEWAYFYRAKAYLQVGELDSARSDLADVISMQGDLAAEAQEVLEQLPD